MYSHMILFFGACSEKPNELPPSPSEPAQEPATEPETAPEPEAPSGTDNDGGREVEAYGISMAVNENLSISYNEHNTTFRKSGSDGADVEQEAQGIAIAYTMGGATLAIQNNTMDNVGGTAASNDEITEVSLSLAF